MLNFSSLPATSGLARRLLAFSRLNGMAFDPTIAELAMQDLIEPARLVGFPHVLNQHDYSTLQYIADWNGRATILDMGPQRLRTLALASLWTRPSGQTLILSRPTDYAEWVDVIQQVWNGASISVFGNQRHVAKNKPLPAGFSFSEKPDIEADFLITSYGGMLWNDIQFLPTLKYTIVEELADLSQVNYKWEDALKGAFKELPSPLFLQDVNFLPKTGGQTILASLAASNSLALLRLSDLMSSYMFGGNKLPTMLLDIKANKGLSSYLAIRGYTGHTMLDLFSCIGVCSDLLRDGTLKSDVMTFYDDTVMNVKGRKHTEEGGVSRLLKLEKNVEASAGHHMTRIVLDALGGDRASQTLLGGLKNASWASLKAQHIKRTVDDLFSYMSRIVIVADNPELIRSLRLQFGNNAEHLGSISDMEHIRGRFITRNMLFNLNRSKPLRIIIASRSDLQTESALLDAANFLIFADSPLDSTDYAMVKNKADQYGLNLVMSVIRGTFEEKVHKHLSKK